MGIFGDLLGVVADVAIPIVEVAAEVVVPVVEHVVIPVVEVAAEVVTPIVEVVVDSLD